MELELKSVSKSYQKGQKIAVDDFSMKFETKWSWKKYADEYDYR